MTLPTPLRRTGKLRTELFRTLLGALLCVLLGALLSACANPAMPTGGPVDRQPPAIAASDPALNAVNVQADAIQIAFTEYVDPASFTRALAVSPAFERAPEVRWHGRTAEVRFPEPLRPNTTYVLTLDTNLRDINGVALTQPLTLAFSTGPQINRGRIGGRVIDAQTGEGAAGYDVYAYVTTDSIAPALPATRPDYRTQTDRTGAFNLSYLAPGAYFAYAVQDRNRNRRPDAGEPFAIPPRLPLRADTTAPDTLAAPWLATALDTVPPAVQRIRPLSARRTEVRFTEPVRLLRPGTSGWALRDSTTGAAAPIRSVYTLPDANRAVYVLTDSLAGARYHLLPAAVADTAGNALRQAAPVGFAPSRAADTVGTRFLGFVPPPDAGAPAGATTLFPGALPGVRFNEPLPEALARQVVSATDTLGTPRPFALTDSLGATYSLRFEHPLGPGNVVRVVVSGRALGGADTVFTHTYRTPADRELGGLSGAVATATPGPIRIELYGATSTRPLRTAVLPAAGPFAFNGLPEGMYRLQAFVDRNENGRWDVGRLVPFSPPEPLARSTDSLRVRPRWENALPDTLRIL